MSIQSFRERAQLKLDESIEEQLSQIKNIHINWIETQVGVVQRPTAEEIGMMTITLTNRLWAFKKAREILDDVFKELSAPPKQQEEGVEDGDGDTEEAERGGYG